MTEKSNLKKKSNGRRKSDSRSLLWKALIVLALAAGVAGAIYLKEQPGKTGTAASGQANSNVQRAETSKHKQEKRLPRLVDLGAGKCIPCKMMVPILEELKREYKDKLEVQVIDVWENRSAAREYRIHLIPTQIFYDAAGKELYRHQGFFGKDAILKKWKELGIELD